MRELARLLAAAGLARVVFAATVLAGCFGASPPTAAWEVQSHRGRGTGFPEASRAAFERAIALGVTTLELDVQASADDILVVHHDLALGADCRDAAGRNLGGRALRMLESSELATVACGGEPLVLLDDVLALVRAAARPVHVSIEIKLQDPDAAPPRERLARLVRDAVRRHGLERRCLVQSFDWPVLREVARVAPELSTAVNVRHRRHFDAALDATGADVLQPRLSALRQDDVERAHARGVAVVAWTVNEASDLERLHHWGVDGVVTDRPELALAVRERLERP